MAAEEPMPSTEAPDVVLDEYGTNATQDETQEAAEADALLREAMEQAHWPVQKKAPMPATTSPALGHANTADSKGIPRERTTRNPAENPFPPTHHARELAPARRSTVWVAMCALCTLAAKPLQSVDRSTPWVSSRC